MLKANLIPFTFKMRSITAPNTIKIEKGGSKRVNRNRTININAVVSKDRADRNLSNIFILVSTQDTPNVELMGAA